MDAIVCIEFGFVDLVANVLKVHIHANSSNSKQLVTGLMEFLYFQADS